MTPKRGSTKSAGHEAEAHGQAHRQPKRATKRRRSRERAKGSTAKRKTAAASKPKRASGSTAKRATASKPKRERRAKPRRLPERRAPPPGAARPGRSADPAPRAPADGPQGPHHRRRRFLGDRARTLPRAIARGGVHRGAGRAPAGRRPRAHGVHPRRHPQPADLQAAAADAGRHGRPLRRAARAGAGKGAGAAARHQRDRLAATARRMREDGGASARSSSAAPPRSTAPSPTLPSSSPRTWRGGFRSGPGSSATSASSRATSRTSARRFDHVSVTTLRYQPTLGTAIDSPLTRYLHQPVVPTQLGYDPLLQFVHAEDAVGALEAAVMRPVRGPVNVAGAGSVSLSRLLRLAGKVPLPIPAPLFSAALGHRRAARPRAPPAGGGAVAAQRPHDRRHPAGGGDRVPAPLDLGGGRGLRRGAARAARAARPAHRGHRQRDHAQRGARGAPAPAHDARTGTPRSASGARRLRLTSGGASATAASRPLTGARPRRSPPAGRRRRQPAPPGAPSTSWARCASAVAHGADLPAALEGAAGALPESVRDVAAPGGAAPARRVLAGRVGLRRGVRRDRLSAVRADVRPLVAGDGDGRRAHPRARPRAARGEPRRRAALGRDDDERRDPEEPSRCRGTRGSWCSTGRSGFHGRARSCAGWAESSPLPTTRCGCWSRGTW